MHFEGKFLDDNFQTWEDFSILNNILSYDEDLGFNIALLIREQTCGICQGFPNETSNPGERVTYGFGSLIWIAV